MEFFTQDDLNVTISSAMMSTNFKIMEHKFEKAYHYGNTKMGNHCRLEVRIKDNDNIRHTLSFFAKFIPEIEEYKNFVQDNDYLGKEAYYYSHISLIMKTLLPSELPLPTPMCYFSRVGSSESVTPESSPKFEASVIVLQDLYPLGYSPKNIWMPLDFPHCRVVMKALAVFHGASVLLQQSKAVNTEHEEVNATILSLRDTIFFSDRDSISNKIVDATIETATTVICQLWPNRFPREKIYNKLLDVLRGSLRNIKSMMNPVGRLISVLCHGELCCNNILFAYDREQQGEQAPVDVKFVDMQHIRYGSPVIDILTFLHVCTRRKFRNQHLNELLSYYQIEIARAVSPKVAHKTLSLEALRACVRDMKELGLMAAICLMPICLAHQRSQVSFSPLHHSGSILGGYTPMSGNHNSYRRYTMNPSNQYQEENAYSLMENQAQKVLDTMEINQWFKVRLEEAYEEYLEFVGLWENSSSHQTT